MALARRIAVLALLTATVAVPTAAPAIDVPTMQVHLQSRVLEVRRATLEGTTLVPGLATATVRCPAGQVALLGGGDPEGAFASVVTSMPAGSRGWRFRVANFDLAETAAAALSVTCARAVLAEPRLTVATGVAAAVVPAATADGPGTATVTGRCKPGTVPVSGGFDAKQELFVTPQVSAASGALTWRLVLRNFDAEAHEAGAAVRCLDGPPGLRVFRSSTHVGIPAATGEGTDLHAGEASGEKACPSGRVLIGGGFRLPSTSDARGFGPVPSLSGVPILGYHFSNIARGPADAELVLLCTPKIIQQEP
jgi:Flp pilus assembly secretin CpaC